MNVNAKVNDGKWSFSLGFENRRLMALMAILMLQKLLQVKSIYPANLPTKLTALMF